MKAWLSGMRLKLLVMVFFPILVMGGVGAFMYSNLHLVADEYKEAATDSIPKMYYAGQMSESLLGISRAVLGAYMADRGSDARAKYTDFYADKKKEFNTSARNYVTYHLSSEEQTLQKEVTELSKKFQTTAEDALKKFSLNTVEGDSEGKKITIDHLRPLALDLITRIDKIKEININSNRDNSTKNLSHMEKQINISGLATVLGMLALVIYGIYITRSLSLAFSSVAQRISNSADHVGATSRELADGSMQLSAGATEAASSLEETVASIEELSSMVKQNAANSGEAGHLSLNARNSAEEGESEVKTLISAMDEIAQSSRKIEEIINVIDDIAFQTNLLALNAAVEAARAGEQGKGFAVVAEAVRSLAQRSLVAAKDITNLIKESSSKVDRGTEIASRSGEMLRTIVTNIKKVADLNAEIASASSEQAKGLTQISQAMNQLDQATQGNAATAEESSAASSNMSREAEALRQEVLNLLLIVEGNKNRAAGYGHVQGQGHGHGHGHGHDGPSLGLGLGLGLGHSQHYNSKHLGSNPSFHLPLNEDEERQANDKYNAA